MGRPIVLLNQYNLQNPLRKGVVYHITTNLCVEMHETFRINNGFVYIMPGARLDVEGRIIVDGGKLTVEGTLNVCRNKVTLREPGILTCLPLGKIAVDGEIEIESGKCFMGGTLHVRNRLSLRSGMLICNPSGVVTVTKGTFEVNKNGFFIMNSAFYTHNGGLIRLSKALFEVGVNVESDDKTIILHNVCESNSFITDFAIEFPGKEHRNYQLITNFCWC